MLAPNSNFFLQETVNWKPPPCFVLFLEIAELVFELQHWKKPILSLTWECLRCFSSLKDCKGPNKSTWSTCSNSEWHYLSTCNKFCHSYKWQYNSTLEDLSEEIKPLLQASAICPEWFTAMSLIRQWWLELTWVSISHWMIEQIMLSQPVANSNTY